MLFSNHIRNHHLDNLRLTADSEKMSQCVERVNKIDPNHGVGIISTAKAKQRNQELGILRVFFSFSFW